MKKIVIYPGLFVGALCWIHWAEAKLCEEEDKWGVEWGGLGHAKAVARARGWDGKSNDGHLWYQGRRLRSNSSGKLSEEEELMLKAFNT